MSLLDLHQYLLRQLQEELYEEEPSVTNMAPLL